MSNKIISNTKSRKEVQDKINQLLQEFWSLDCKDKEAADEWAEKLREWLMTMEASKAAEMPYMETVIGYGTLMNIVRNRTQAES